MKRLRQLLSRNRHAYHPLVFQAISAIEHNNPQQEDDDDPKKKKTKKDKSAASANKSDRDKKLESDLQGLRNHLLTLGKTESRLNVLKDKKAALIGQGSLPNVTSATEPLVQGAEASALPDQQYSGLMEVLQASKVRVTIIVIPYAIMICKKPKNEIKSGLITYIRI